MNIPPLATQASPRVVLLSHFKSLGGILPIRGGWGYSMQDACILDDQDPALGDVLPFDWFSWQNVFVEKRIYEELIIQRPLDDRFSGIQWNLQNQVLVNEGDRFYDHLTFEVKALPDRDWNELKAEFEGPNGIENPDFDFAGHLKKREQKSVTFTREYWFDISGKFC